MSHNLTNNTHNTTISHNLTASHNHSISHNVSPHNVSHNVSRNLSEPGMSTAPPVMAHSQSIKQTGYLPAPAIQPFFGRPDSVPTSLNALCPHSRAEVVLPPLLHLTLTLSLSHSHTYYPCSLNPSQFPPPLTAPIRRSPASGASPTSLQACKPFPTSPPASLHCLGAMVLSKATGCPTS